MSSRAEVVESPSARDEVVLALADPDRRLQRVRVVQELWRPRVGPDFARRGGGATWELRFPRPAADRMEYQLELTDPDGSTAIVCDPGNPLRAPGPFGEKSVLELPGYHAPAWLSSPAPSGRTRTVEIPSRTLGAALPVTIWEPPETRPGRALPLLVANDGPEYAEYSALTGFLAGGCAAGELPPLRAALVPPVARNRDYSASARYARALAREILPRLEPFAPTAGGARRRAGMGTSLGALAMLHAQRSRSRPLRRPLPSVGKLLPAALRQVRDRLSPLRPHLPLRGSGARLL